MQVQDEDKPYDDINITPMLDLAYVLLIIFIILTTASVQGIKVELPKASASVSLAKPQTKAITVNSSDVASKPPSRSSVTQEMRSPGPKQPQSICMPFSIALIIRLKKTTSSRDVLNVEARRHKPATNDIPSRSSHQGSPRATNSTAHEGSTW